MKQCSTSYFYNIGFKSRCCEIIPHFDPGYCLDSGVSRISFRGGGGVQNIFVKVGVFFFATRLLGGSGVCSPEKIFKNGAIWCVLEKIWLTFCKKKNCKNNHFLYKNNR